MIEKVYRPVRDSDIPAMAEIRAGDWGTQEYWQERIEKYLSHQLGPKQALAARTAFVCVEGEQVIGLVAGHLTRRFDCEGELEWISVRAQFRRCGVASKLLRHIFEWYIAHNASRICVDVEPSNELARRFYHRHGAVDLKPHWMVWNDIRQCSFPTD
jgi:ribosomal protein S18 acetylase RimI-like enzyme